MNNIQIMSEKLLAAKSLATSGASLAIQSQEVINGIDEILEKLAVIQSDRDMADKLRDVIGTDSMDYVTKVAGILYSTRAQIAALEV